MKITALIAAAVFGVVLVLSSCTAQAAQAGPLVVTPYEGNNLHYADVYLPNGHTIPCIVYYGNGVSCDWVGNYAREAGVPR